MKRIIMLVLLFAAIKVAGQTTGYLRFDTVKIMKQGGACELYVINKTKDSLGLLTNVGGGLTRFIKSKMLNDSTIVIGLDTLVIPGAGSSGSSLSLNNVGTGYRLVTTPNGSIKTLIPGDGQLIDSAATTLTIRRDTTGANGSVTRSELKDTANNIRSRVETKAVVTQLEGLAYNKSVFTSTGDFTQRGSFTASVSSNAIAISGGNNDFAETLDLDTTLRERWVMHIEQKVGTISSTSDGLGIGVRSVNPNAAYGVAGILVTNNTGNSGKLLLIDTYNSSVIETSTSAISFSAGDTIVFELERDRLLLTLKGWNKTTGSATISVSYLYTLDEGPAHVLPNAGTFSVFNVGGSQTMTALTITSKEAKNAPLLLQLDSKAWYYAAGQTYGTLLDAVFRPTNIHGGPADRTIELLAAQDEVIAQTPVNLAISIGSNDIGSGYSVGQTFTRYKQYVARAEAAGINVLHLLPFYQPTIVAQLDSLADSIRTQYPTKIIDCRTPLRRCPSCFLASDNVHLNADGNELVYNTIINSGKLTSYYKTPVAGGSSSTGGLDDVLAVGDNSTRSMELTGTNTTDSKLKIGSLEIQPFAFNGIQIADNGYYNGSNDVRRASGYASRVLLQNGHVFFATAGSSTAGSTIAYNLGLLADPTGNVGIGGMNPASPSYSDGQLNITASNGRVNIPGASGLTSKLAIGSLEVQPFSSVNGVQIVENGYYNGSANVRRSNGYAARMVMQNGSIVMSTAGTSTAGSSITFNTPWFSDASGNVGMGVGMSEGGPIHTDAALYIPNSTGNVNVKNNLVVAGDATVADEAYDASGWNGSTEVPTKNAIRDKIESLSLTTIYSGDGSLAGNRTITGGNNTLTITGTQASAAAFTVSNTGNGDGMSAVTTGTGNAISTANSGTGTAGTFSSNSGHAVNATSTSGTLFRGVVNPSSTNTEVTTLRTIRQTSGTAAANMGQIWSMDLEDDAGNNVAAVLQKAIWTSAVGGSTSADYQLWTIGSGTSSKKFTIKGSGQIEHNSYGAGSFTVTPATTPVYSSAGVIGERIAPKIYTALLTQSGTGNPTATILGTNEIGSIVWTRNSTGNYTGTLTGAFTADKTWLVVQKGDGVGSFVNALLYRASANALTLDVRDNSATLTDGFTNMSIEIRVYP